MSILHSVPLASQLINLCAAVLLLLGFAMLAQRRILSLINLFMLQGLVLFASTLIVAYSTAQHHLYWSAGLYIFTALYAALFVNVFIGWAMWRHEERGDTTGLADASDEVVQAIAEP